MVDRTATLKQKLAALAAAEADKDNVFIQERGRHNATEADKDNAFKLFTSWKALQRSTGERMAALLRELMTGGRGGAGSLLEARTRLIDRIARA